MLWEKGNKGRLTEEMRLKGERKLRRKCEGKISES